MVLDFNAELLEYVVHCPVTYSTSIRNINKAFNKYWTRVSYDSWTHTVHCWKLKDRVTEYITVLTFMLFIHGHDDNKYVLFMNIKFILEERKLFPREFELVQVWLSTHQWHSKFSCLSVTCIYFRNRYRCTACHIDKEPVAAAADLI